MMSKRALQSEQWEMLHRLNSVGCPVDYEHLQTPLHVFTELKATQFFPMSGATGIALPIRIDASTSITIRRFRLRLPWLPVEVSWLGSCEQHLGKQKYYCFQRCSGLNGQFSSEDVLNHRTLHRGVLKGGGFLSGFLLGTFRGGVPPTHLGTKLQATLSIEDLFERGYHFPIELFDPPSESEWEDWWRQRASATTEGKLMPPTGNEDEPM